ncbi:MAG: hypothetical protein F4Z18_12905 [Caldilineaceae bacterium SB0666_bin_21]|nr:hypothetical protein [Caldilineaceae bacterium SB0666_bin_21]
MLPQLDAPSEATVRRLVDDLIADLEAIPDHRDRVYPLASLLAHPCAGRLRTEHVSAVMGILRRTSLNVTLHLPCD